MFSEWSRPYPHLDPGAPRENVLILRFRDGAVRNERLSADGPSVYDRVFQVQVSCMGQKQSAPIYELLRIVEGKDKVSSPAEYAQFRLAFDAYRANTEPALEGTPLEHWPLMTTEIVRAFKDANVLTVEMLAAAGDNVAHAVRAPFYDWRAKAKTWLEQAKAGASVKQSAELAAAQRKIAEMEAQIQQLLAVQNGASPQPKGFTKGRKKANGHAELDISIPDEAMTEFDEDRV